MYLNILYKLSIGSFPAYMSIANSLKRVLLLDTGHPFVDDQFIAIGCAEGSRIAHERCRDETITEQILLPHGIGQP